MEGWEQLSISFPSLSLPSSGSSPEQMAVGPGQDGRFSVV